MHWLQQEALGLGEATAVAEKAVVRQPRGAGVEALSDLAIRCLDCAIGQSPVESVAEVVVEDAVFEFFSVALEPLGVALEVVRTGGLGALSLTVGALRRLCEFYLLSLDGAPFGLVFVPLSGPSLGMAAHKYLCSLRLRVHFKLGVTRLNEYAVRLGNIGISGQSRGPESSRRAQDDEQHCRQDCEVRPRRHDCGGPPVAAVKE
mmetsp:Transcript_27013/g.67302  ORF Transcript_27013/g.67302 Transcript_27013/m.67302 type:complete len:204 (+) Transcript_27013:913-1524(+)